MNTERYTFRDFKTKRERFTRGRFVKWSEPTGLLATRYAIFATRRGEVIVPFYLLTAESIGKLPPRPE